MRNIGTLLCVFVAMVGCATRVAQKEEQTPPASIYHYLDMAFGHNVPEQHFYNTNCQKTNSCSLKRFSMYVEPLVLTFEDGGVSFGTTMAAEYETESVEHLDEYAFVQFIRGCLFDTWFKAPQLKDGPPENIFGYAKYQFDKLITFRFPAWVIDSVDADPMYNSGEESERHFLYRWNTTAGSRAWGTQKFFGKEKPIVPSLYVLDHPIGGMMYEAHSVKHASNISLDFRMCIYHASDIPAIGREDEVNFAKPLHCFPWRASRTYNTKTKSFESSTTVHPFCSEPEPEH